MAPTPTPTTATGLIGALVFLGGALAGALVGAALTARQAREEPRGGDTGTRNVEMHRRLPPPLSVERDNPSDDEGSRDLEEAHVEGGGGGYVGEEEVERRRNTKILIVMLATQAVIMLMIIFNIGSKSKVPGLLVLSLSLGIIVYLCLDVEL